MVALIRATSPDEWAVAGRLVDEYAASLGIALDFQNFAHERTHLAEEYGPPHAMFLLATDAGAFVGCGGLRRHSEAACEMKRLYVTPQGQGRGVGRQIALALIADARAMGYRTILLDTLPSMQRAQRLYRSLGFEPTAPYRFNPVEGTAFLALDLSRPAAAGGPPGE